MAAGANNGCRPVSAYMNNTQYRGAGDSNYHGLHLTYLQRPKDWSAVRVSYALSKSMNDVGEAFFSSPIDPADVMKDWGRSDNDQRHRLVVSASVNSPMTPGTGAWERISHGFQVSTMVQYYSSLPFNIVSGGQQLAGTGGGRIEGLIEAFNLTDRVNPITRNTTFGPGSYPSNSASSFNTVTAMGDPRTLQFAVRLIF